jgi:GNAT superfamily N-acetyltransferase
MIRTATPEDLEDLIRLSLEFIDESIYREFGSSPEQLTFLFEHIFGLSTHGGAGTILVAEGVDGQLAGMLAIVVVPHLLSGQLYADEIAWFVRPRYRSGLVGPRLLRAAEHWAMQNRANLIRMVAPQGTDVGRFYEKAGYAAVETSYSKRLEAWPDSRQRSRSSDSPQA